MRPGAPLVVVVMAAAALAAAGCASSDDGSAGGSEPIARLAAVDFPQTPFVASADAPPESVRRASARAHRRAAAKAAARSQSAAPEPSTAAGQGSAVAPGAPSDAEVRAQLAQLYGETGGSAATAGGPAGLSNSVTLTDGEVTAPPDAPVAVQKIVDGANQVARLPYVYGGGHGRADGLFIDSAYDCSGSISFALANAGLLDSPVTSGQLANWGRPGQGKWVTIYANATHAFMVVGGARFDTVGLRQTGSRWQRPFRSISGFTAVHPPGL
jgi:cell wall-associated NlpC family hydrolase